ncbi:uncharacterized protein IUM83_07093 [Phytophthora cinnamomi]|uniref:uncharacterized protein n=1 Tax=Phytophthora cinnamomi TaxID=4785 RepID=UPI003559A0AC|nr:hypothetical protein IUM83_07093 [Phytophthora cinnamomi]
MTVEHGGLGRAQAGASPSSGPGASSRAPLDEIAAAAARAPRAPLSSPRTTSAVLLASLPPTDDFDFDPGHVEPFLLLDDEGVPVGPRGALSPAPARVQDGDEGPSCLVDLDAILAESDDVGEEEVVDQGRPDTFYRYADEHFGGAGASATGRCFMEALHAACYHLDNPSLITEDHLECFDKQHKREMTYGVKHEDMAEFFKFLERDCLSLDYNELYKSRQIDSLNSLADFVAFVRREKLEYGCYLVCAGQHRLDHCIVLVVRLHQGPLMAYDVWEEFEDPPCWMKPLTKINTVKAIYRIKEGPKPEPPRGKRLTKTDKKRARKAATKSAKNAKKRAKQRSQG